MENPTHRVNITSMSEIDLEHYDIYVAFGRQQFPTDPVHWLIMMGHPGAERCFRFHCEGWEGNWQVAIESGKRFESWWIRSKTSVGRITAQDGSLVEEQANEIAPQNACLWVLELLQRIEGLGLIPEGTHEWWKDYYSTNTSTLSGSTGAEASDST